MPRKSKTGASLAEMSPYDYISILPGYDPWRDAEEYEFNPEWAEPTISWIESNLVHTEGELAGTPYILAPHQRAIQYMLWGWKHKEHGYRRITEVWFYVPRKNSKTTDCAVVLLTILLCDPTRRMQVYSCGSAENQAALVYDAMVAQRTYNKAIEERTAVRKVPKSIIRTADNSVYMPLPDNAKAQHGKNVRAVLCDETHTYDSDDQVVAMRTGMATQKEPLMMHATTADFIRESYCNRRYEYAVKVRDGDIKNPRFLPVIYEVSQEDLKNDPDAWKKEEYWKKANPLYGLSVQKDFMERECQQAIDDPTYENEFKRLHLNIRTETSQRMISSAIWEGCDGVIDFEGRAVVGAALDLGSVSDMCSLCLLFDRPGGGWDAKWWHWIPMAKAQEHEVKRGWPFSMWARDGWIECTEGNEIDYEYIEECIVRINDEFMIPRLYADRKFQGAQICQNLIKRGWDVGAFNCGFLNMDMPTRELLRRLSRKEFGHGNNPVMRWQASNAVAMVNSTDLMRPVKAKGDRDGKIDGIVTAVIAVAMAMEAREDGASVYETRGFLEFGKT